MKFCNSHWESLRQAIQDRGLTPLISSSGEEAAEKLADELQRGENVDNFDPLMRAHNAIWANAMSFVADGGGNPLAMLDPEAPDKVQCPICYLNDASQRHDELCKDPHCPGRGQPPRKWEWMIDRAADDALETWKSYKL